MSPQIFLSGSLLSLYLLWTLDRTYIDLEEYDMYKTNVLYIQICKIQSHASGGIHLGFFTICSYLTHLLHSLYLGL